MNNKLIVGLVVVLVVGLGISSASAAKAQTKSFLDRLLEHPVISQIIGKAVSERIADTVQSEIETLPVEEILTFGAPEDIFRTEKMELITISTGTTAGVTLPDTSSTSLDQGQFLNPTRANGGRRRLITEIGVALVSTTGTYLPASATAPPLRVEWNTSTGEFTSGTAAIQVADIATSSILLLAFEYRTTTTLANTPSLVQDATNTLFWEPGVYFHCTLNRVVSTTGGNCYVKYVNLD